LFPKKDARVMLLKKEESSDVLNRLQESYKDYVFTTFGVNSYLKEIADLCEIEKNLTFHLARHTFATTITLTNGVPIETVSKLLGHSSIRTTQIYAKVVEKKVQEDMNMLKQKLG
jgi:site-specific recombinase XerD